MIKIIFVCFAIVCFCINANSTLSQAIQLDPSPAGGNYLSLNGKYEYAVVDFEKAGTLLDENTTKLTVEAWVYPTSPPEKDTEAVILGQQILIYVVNNENPYYAEVFKDLNIKWNKNDLLLIMMAFINLDRANTGFIPLILSLNQWHHIAFQTQDNQKAWICDNIYKSAGGDFSGLKVAWIVPMEDFVLGGYGQKFPIENSQYFIGGFSGYIDEVRISNIPRYDIKGQLIPQGRFEPDANTVALWHFDERKETYIFHDSSLNHYDLAGKNGTTTNGPLAVSGVCKLVSMWGRIKKGDEK